MRRCYWACNSPRIHNPQSPMEKPLPIITADSAPFWDGCRDGKLSLQRCAACESWRYPPAPVCPHDSEGYRWPEHKRSDKEGGGSQRERKQSSCYQWWEY